MHRKTIAGLIALAIASPIAFAVPADEKPAGTFVPHIHPASEEAEQAISGFKVPEGLTVSVFAAEPMLANPVALCTDETGRFYLIETFRFGGGTLDVRGHMYMLDDDLAARTVKDRIAYTRKHFKDRVGELAIASDRLRLIEDRDGDGKADISHIFADGFNGIEEGLAAGVLARKGDVYFANIPHLWLLRDTDGDGRADVRKPLQSGYGVRFAFIGHDLHGLVIGPDGKLYMSMGDRGLNVKSGAGEVAYPDAGAVLRCNLDGSGLELFATGLRNPQELAFDQYGNLFTGDNNCDRGDPARWVYVVEGGDSGWRIGYQTVKSYDGQGPWIAERLFATEADSTAAYIVPPIDHIAAGPSGIGYYPGTGLHDRYINHFFLCDFRGHTNSGIYSFVMKPKGASFQLDQREEFIWNILPVDFEWGVDGGMYIADWTSGWSLPGKGRIYRLFNPDVVKSPLVLETKRLINEGMERRSSAEVARLLAHPDMRIRQEAQFELAGRGAASVEILSDVARRSDHQLARIHALWGLGQLAPAHPTALAAIHDRLGDRDDEVRVQAIKVAGDARSAGAFPDLLRCITDHSLRVRYHAALALGKLGDRRAIGSVLELLRANDDREAYIRHAGVMALTWLGDRQALLAAASDESPAVRMGVLLAMRRLEMPDVAGFLGDSREELVLEAARAINDTPVEAAMPALASLVSDRRSLPRPIAIRAINASWRIGSLDHASAVAALAARTDLPAPIRLDALQALEEWESASGRDRITGLWRPAAGRQASAIAQVVRPILPDILRSAPDAVRAAGARLAGRFGAGDPEMLFELVAASELSGSVRAAALRAMGRQNEPRLADAVGIALREGTGELRQEGIRLQVRLPDAPAQLEMLLSAGSIPDQQTVLATLAAISHPVVDAILSRMLDTLLAGKLAPELHLDLLEAASISKSDQVRLKVRQFEASRPKDDPLADYAEALAGGDPELGRKLFFEREDLSCVRCHVPTPDNVIAGPDLAGIGSRKDRRYLLSSILYPNQEIAPGFENVVIEVKTGRRYNGLLKAETESELSIEIPDTGIVKIDRADLVSRSRGPSAMPEDLAKPLTRRELRDLVEFLATMTEP